MICAANACSFQPPRITVRPGGYTRAMEQEKKEMLTARKERDIKRKDFKKIKKEAGP